MIGGEVAKLLDLSTRPVDGCMDWTCCVSQSEENIFAVLAEKSGASVQHFCLLAGGSFNRDSRSDRVPIALRSFQAKGDCGREVAEFVLEEPELGSIAIFEQ